MNNQPQPAGSKVKTYGVIAIVVLVFVLIYFYSSGGAPAAGNIVAGTSYGSIGSSELDLLNQVRSMRIDTSLFSDPAFLSLQDYSVAIAPEGVGRPNPFAPLPGELIKPAASAKSK